MDQEEVYVGVPVNDSEEEERTEQITGSNNPPDTAPSTTSTMSTTQPPALQRTTTMHQLAVERHLTESGLVGTAMGTAIEAQRAREEELSQQFARLLQLEEEVAQSEANRRMRRHSNREAAAAAPTSPPQGASASWGVQLVEGGGESLRTRVAQRNLSYGDLIQLGRNIEDVDVDPWQLPSHVNDSSSAAAATAIERTCPICQLDYQASDHLRRLSCGHRFHSTCINRWLSRKSLCPCCRKTIG